LLPAVIKQFSQKFPHAELSVHENLTDELIQQLIAGKLDVGIMSLPIRNKLIATEELFTEPLLIASPQNHELITRSAIRANELHNFPFIALNEVHCLGEQIQSFCYQQSIDVDIVCQTAQLATVQSCVALGLGISLVPQMLAAQDTSGMIAYRMVSDTTPRRRVVAASHRGRLPSFLSRQFVALVREEYDHLTSDFARRYSPLQA
jgi:LysR family hydrogen peroxide-inducible transcriptional activator